MVVITPITMKKTFRGVIFCRPASGPRPSVYSPHLGQRTMSAGIWAPQ